MVSWFYNQQRESKAPQAFYDFSSDVEVHCGTHLLALTASRGFTSPVYLVEYDLPLTNRSGDVLYPCHMVDWAVMNNETDSPFFSLTLGATEIQAGEEIRRAVMGLVRTGRAPNLTPLPGRAAPYTLVNSLDRDPTSGHVGFTPQIAFKEQLCSKLLTHSLGENFWWVN